MSADKEVYVESSISLEGKYPQFSMEGDEKEDVIVRFSADPDSKVVLAEGAEDDIGGPLELHMSKDGDKLVAVRFPGAVKRWKLERISVRFEEDRDLVYIRFRWFLRQELSLEIDELDEDLVIDLDKKDRVIGLAVLNASTHLEASTLANLASGSEWIKLLVISSEFESLEAVRAAKKAKKKAKKLVATEAARVVATPSPSLISADPASFGEYNAPNQPPKVVHSQAPKKRRVYTGAKVNLIPQDGVAAANNLGDESQHTYFSNRFVRDLEWVLNFPFILAEPNQLLSSSGSIPPPVASTSAQPSNNTKSLPLVPSAWCDLGKTTHQFLAELDANPDLYLPWIRERLSRSNNLGGYFTLLLEFILGHSQNVLKVCPKYQMFSEDKRTVGDFDFLLELKDDPKDSKKAGESAVVLDGEAKKSHWVHWEVGIKFYLLLGSEGPEAGFPAFIGPHCTGDSLEKYINKTVKQLELRHVDQVVAQLRAEDRVPTDSHFFLKGYVFFPLTSAYYETEQETSSVPFYSGNLSDPYPVDYWAESPGWLYERRALRAGGLNGGPVAGWWAQYPHAFPYNENGDSAADMSEENMEMIRKDESLDFDILLLDALPLTLVKQEKLQHSMWTILNKMDYMAPLLVTPQRPDVHLIGYHALKRAVKMCFATNYRSLFIAEVVPYSRSQYRDCPNPMHVTHVEVSRGFIVGQHWPSAPKDVDLNDSR